MNSCIFLLLISCLCNNNCGMNAGNCVQNDTNCNDVCKDKCMCENNSNVRGDDCGCEHHHHHYDNECGCEIPQAWQRGNEDCDRNTRSNYDDRRMSPPPVRNNDCSLNR